MTHISKKRFSTASKDWNLTFGLKKVEDGIVVTQDILPVGIGKLVYFLNPKKKNSKIVPGIVMSSEKNATIVFILGQNYLVTTEHLITLFKSSSGDYKTDFIVELKISKLLGQTLDIFGNSYNSDKTHFLDLPKPLNGVSDRINVWKPLVTGIKVVDCLFPIGLGQRQLIIGDRYTGKTTIAVDAILCQKKTKIKCIFVSIGQKKSSVNKLISTFIKNEAFYYTTMISADSSDPVALQFLAPYTGCSLAEIFSVLGGDSLIIYDDLSKHAVAYRQMALLLRKSPGRDAFPSDIFYLHSNLLERAGQFFTGSLTALPIVETLARDVSAYIPTNIISITDGQLFLDSSYFNRGILPAVHVSLSVSRVGSKSQYPCMGNMCKWDKAKIKEVRELESLLSFTDDIDKVTAAKLKFGLRLSEFLCQMKNEPVNYYDQIILFALVYKGSLKYYDVDAVQGFVKFVIRWNNEFLLRTKSLNSSIYFSSFEHVWNFNFGDKNFMDSKNFIIFYCYINNLFIKFLNA